MQQRDTHMGIADELWLFSERMLAGRPVFCRVVLEMPERPRGAFRVLSRLQALDGEVMGDVSVFQRHGAARDDSWLLAPEEPPQLIGRVRKWTMADSVFKNRPLEADSRSWCVRPRDASGLSSRS